MLQFLLNFGQSFNGTYLSVFLWNIFGGASTPPTVVMKFIAWNVRVVKKPQIREEFRFIIHAHQPDTLFLTEKMVAGKATKRLISQFGFYFYDFVNPVNHSGGLWVLWNNTIIIANVLLKEQCFIHMLVLDIKTQHLSTISNVYAPTKGSEKPSFWHHLIELNAVIDTPWCFIGNFNELEEGTDKKGGTPISPLQCVKLLNFLNTVNATTFPILSGPYT